MAAEADLRGGTGKAREQEGAENREAQQAHEGFNRDQNIGRSRVRDQLAVADGGERLDAEEHAVLEARQGRGGGARDRLRAGEPVEAREQEVHRDVARRHQESRARDRKGNQRVIDVVRMERAQVVAADVEAAVAVEQPGLARSESLPPRPRSWFRRSC